MSMRRGSLSHAAMLAPFVRCTDAGLRRGTAKSPHASQVLVGRGGRRLPSVRRCVVGGRARHWRRRVARAAKGESVAVRVRRHSHRRPFRGRGRRRAAEIRWACAAQVTRRRTRQKEKRHKVAEKPGRRRPPWPLLAAASPRRHSLAAPPRTRRRGSPGGAQLDTNTVIFSAPSQGNGPASRRVSRSVRNGRTQARVRGAAAGRLTRAVGGTVPGARAVRQWRGRR